LESNLRPLEFEKILKSYYQAKALSMKAAIDVPVINSINQIFFIDTKYTDERAEVLESFAHFHNLSSVMKDITTADVETKQLIYFSPESIDEKIEDKELFQYNFNAISESNEIQVFYAIDHQYFKKNKDSPNFLSYF
jgi:hypothetical protein